MLKLLATTAMELEKIITVISSISDYTEIEFSENFIQFYATHRTTNDLALLHLSTNFLEYYDISRSFIIKGFSAHLLRIKDFLGDQPSNDDAVVIYSDDESPITSLEFFLRTSEATNHRIKFMTMEVTELHEHPAYYEPIHEFKAPINSKSFRNIAMYSAQYKTPIVISVTSTLCLSLASGPETIQDVTEIIIENAPQTMKYELRLPYSLANSIISASSISEVVCLRDSYSSEDSTVIEFIFDQYSSLTFYIRKPLVDL